VLWRSRAAGKSSERVICTPLSLAPALRSPARRCSGGSRSLVNFIDLGDDGEKGGIIDAVFIVSALGMFTLACYKYHGVRHAPPEQRRTIRSICGVGWGAAPGLLLVAPTVPENLDRLVGIPNLSVLLLYLSTQVWICSAQMTLLYWRQCAEQVWWTARRTGWAYAWLGVVMIILFVLGSPSPEHAAAFPLAFARTPYLSELAIIHFTCYLVAMIYIAYRCLRWARQTPDDQVWLRVGLRLLALAAPVGPGAYAAVTLVAIAVSWFGVNLESWVVGSPLLACLGVPPCVIGMTIPVWGPLLPVMRVRFVRYRADFVDYWRLGPLWRALVHVSPDMVHTPASLWERFSLQARLFWRMIEINDWLQQLSAYRDPALAEAVSAWGRRQELPADSIRAITEAAQIRGALIARAAGEDAAHAGADTDDALDETALASVLSERARLAQVAEYLSSPVVDGFLPSR
jgi:hypothetical protein